jgi:hypothetical protein
VVPIGEISLPQSITQEQEEAHLKNAFGVESLPETALKHNKVHVMQSGGAGGPERKRRSLILLALVILIVGGGVLVYFAHKNGQLQGLLGQ